MDNNNNMKRNMDRVDTDTSNLLSNAMFYMKRKPMPSYALIRVDKKYVVKRMMVRAAVVKKEEIMEFIVRLNQYEQEAPAPVA